MNDRVWVEIQPEAKPICGVVHGRDGRDEGFTGWLELVALLEAAIEPASFDPRRPMTREER